MTKVPSADWILSTMCLKLIVFTKLVKLYLNLGLATTFAVMVSSLTLDSFCTFRPFDWKPETLPISWQHIRPYCQLTLSSIGRRGNGYETEECREEQEPSGQELVKVLPMVTTKVSIEQVNLPVQSCNPYSFQATEEIGDTQSMHGSSSSSSTSVNASKLSGKIVHPGCVEWNFLPL